MPNFTILNSGLTAANTAQANGIKLTFGSFSLGSGVGYTPAATDTGLTGAAVYTAPVTSVVTYNAEAVDVMLSIPAGAGPFNYGEVVIYLDTGVAFAKLAYAALQSKLQTTAASGGSTIVIHAILKLIQGSGIINIITGGTGKIPVYGDFSGITTPWTMSGDPYEALVFEPTIWSQPVHIVRQSNNYWAPQNYTLVHSTTLSAVTTSGGVSVVAAPNFGAPFIQQNNEGERQYLIADGNGNLCGIRTFVGADAWLERTVSWLAAGTNVNVYRATYMITNPDTGTPGRLGRSDLIYNGAGMVSYNSGHSYPVGTVGQRLNADIVNTQRLYDSMLAMADALNPVATISAFIGPGGSGFNYAAGDVWAYCNGQTIDTNGRADLAMLATRVGAVAGVVTIPDLRGEFLRGLDDGRGVVGNTQASRNVGSWEDGSFASHTHADGTFVNLLKVPYPGSLTGGDTGQSGVEQAVGVGDGGPMLAVGGVETRPRNVAVRYIMRVRSFAPTTLS